MKKSRKDMQLIRQKMDLTFSLRRKEIVEMELMVLEIQERCLIVLFKAYSEWHCLTMLYFLIRTNVDLIV